MSAPSLDLKHIREHAERAVRTDADHIGARHSTVLALVDRITELTERLATAEGLLRRAREVERTDQVSDAKYDAERDKIGKRIDAFLSNQKEAAE